MRCPKCKGKMYAEKFYDFVRGFDAWKCYSCGEMVDHTILANRARRQNVFVG
jgi:transposase-like protein